MKRLENIVVTVVMIMAGIGMMASMFISAVTHNAMWFVVTFSCGALIKALDNYIMGEIED